MAKQIVYAERSVIENEMNTFALIHEWKETKH